MRDLAQTYSLCRLMASDIIDDIETMQDSGREFTSEEIAYIHLLAHWARSIFEMEMKHTEILKNLIDIDESP